MTESIAEMIREAQRPRGEMFDLSDKAARLGRAIKVAEKWVEAARETGEMHERAETIHDELEEELARVAWAMELSSERRRGEVFNKRHPEERKVDEGVARAVSLSSSLLEAYNILAGIPQEYRGLCGDEASDRTRYRLMGALLVANDAANDELTSLDPHAKA